MPSDIVDQEGNVVPDDWKKEITERVDHEIQDAVDKAHNAYLRSLYRDGTGQYNPAVSDYTRSDIKKAFDLGVKVGSVLLHDEIKQLKRYL